MTLEEQLRMRYLDLGLCDESLSLGERREIAVRETIRLMEWSRRECCTKTPDPDATPVTHGHTPLRWTPLTLPEESWKP